MAIKLYETLPPGDVQAWAIPRKHIVTAEGSNYYAYAASYPYDDKVRRANRFVGPYLEDGEYAEGDIVDIPETATLNSGEVISGPEAQYICIRPLSRGTPATHPVTGVLRETYWEVFRPGLTVSAGPPVLPTADPDDQTAEPAYSHSFFMNEMMQGNPGGSAAFQPEAPGQFKLGRRVRDQDDAGQIIEVWEPIQGQGPPLNYPTWSNVRAAPKLVLGMNRMDANGVDQSSFFRSLNAGGGGYFYIKWGDQWWLQATIVLVRPSVSDDLRYIAHGIPINQDARMAVENIPAMQNVEIRWSRMNPVEAAPVVEPPPSPPMNQP